ncbi:MAG: hypothetical protein AB8H79_02765 [Myxococcota bacterium]
MTGRFAAFFVSVLTLSSAPAFAGSSVELQLEVPVSGAKAGALSDVILGVFDADGHITGTCVSGSKTELVSGGESHWLSSNGKGVWRCDVTGKISGESVLVLSSKTVGQVWLASAVGKNEAVLLTLDGSKVGAMTAHDPAGFDIDGEEPTWFDIDGEEPTWFDIDGEEPTWFDTKWLKSALSKMASF